MKYNPKSEIRNPELASLLPIPLAALAIVCLLAVAPTEAATKVFLLGGQSNMAGVGQYPGGVINGQTIPPEPAIVHPYDDPQPDVKFWYNNAWTDLRPGFGYQPSEIGPEVTFGYRLNQLFPDDDIYLVKYAESGSNLAVQWKPDGTGAVYNAFKSMVNAALQNLNNAHLNPEVVGMIWMQGESDANKHEYAVNYAANLKALINKVRLDFGADMRFVIGRIDDWPWGAAADCELVRAAQQTVAEAAVGVADPIAPPAAGREESVAVVMVVESQSDLLEVVDALHPPRGLAGGLHGRQEQGDQDANDRDHHEQLDQRETMRGEGRVARDGGFMILPVLSTGH